ncbi:hypothetical protein [Paracoccus sp. ME4]|uniref:hypothetical protein n=1 Tax=Paracoccus sp. ME4 TaxID=3138066 RepID=UPI00398AA08A
MIRRQWVFRAALAALAMGAVQGCASGLTRMPPAAYAPAAPMAPAVAPAPYAPAPYAPAPYQPAAPYPATAGYPSVVPAPAVADLPPPATGITGLTEREPDLCKGSSYASSIGQPSSVIPNLGITKVYRVVEYRGIEPQDYDPNRIVFRLDAAGTITNIDCG